MNHTYNCFFLFAASFSSLPAEAILEKQSNTEFEKFVTFFHEGQTFTLEATGASLRRKWFVKGYAVAHYMQNPTKGSLESVFYEIFSKDKARQLTLNWLHKLPLALIREGFLECLQKNLKEVRYCALKTEIDQFLFFFKVDAKVGDITILRWLPGGYFELIHNDEKLGSFINPKLAEALWGIWLGPDSVVSRKQLIDLVAIN